MHKIKKLLDNMEYYDLINLNQNIKKGQFDFNVLLKQTLKNKEKEHIKYCSVCGNDLEPNNITNYTLIFGPDDFKKKASFCALDCMEYFMVKLKNIKENNLENNQSVNQTINKEKDIEN
jgi:hypothetical protein